MLMLMHASYAAGTERGKISQREALVSHLEACGLGRCAAADMACAVRSTRAIQTMRSQQEWLAGGKIHIRLEGNTRIQANRY